ncbi:hypothetical protein GCM10017608_05900 [Agromyces luteolus]|uniref:Dinucleotide-utilizing enzyme n=1 Tax=Agromyces luteolus TaxID=88373 RepID=A0A7C9HPS7_9MICO|nr:hypothetical protein [Agromyces luteolus]MUN06309.1 hypothetical protein [Agromyces luteolus]GLK26658.1 hypothetical protein GCM10017608_05900 [Agromyces luteolus]
MPASRRSISLAALVIPPFALVASIAVLVLGIAMTIAENDALVAALNSPDGTAADVYGGQSRVVVAAAVLTAGILAVVVSLATIAIAGSIRAFAPRAETAAALATDADADGAEADEVDDDEAGGIEAFDTDDDLDAAGDVTPGASSRAR